MLISNSAKILALVLAATSRAGELSPAAELPPAAEQMAKTYGLDSFGQIEDIRYTFNVEFHGVKISRFLAPGNGNPRPARLPMKAKIKTATR